MEAEIKNIKEDLEELKKVITKMKERMVDIDMVLTSEEEKRLENSLEEYKNRKVILLEDFEKEVQ